MRSDGMGWGRWVGMGTVGGDGAGGGGGRGGMLGWIGWKEHGARQI